MVDSGRNLLAGRSTRRRRKTVRGYARHVVQDWLLVETLGSDPVIVAQGSQHKNFVPIGIFLRRSPNLSAIQATIAATVAGGTGLLSVAPSGRLIRTHPSQMSDGRIHAVHVWCGTPDTEPPERAVPGPLLWNLTTGEGTGTIQFFINAGMDPGTEETTGRNFAEDFPSRSLNADEATALSLAIDGAPGRTYCAAWEFVDKQGLFRKVGWVARSALETAADGTEQLIVRALNWVQSVGSEKSGSEDLARRVVEGLAQPGVYRAVVDLRNWTLLKWLDDPCPYYDWRGRVQMHPDDYRRHRVPMTAELEAGAASRVLRLAGEDGDWVPLHITLSRMELDNGVYGGLMLLRLPTAGELREAGIDPTGQGRRKQPAGN
jgi:hypothetical protein